MLDSAEDQKKLGNLLKQQGRRQEAMECYRRAITLRPHFPEACNNLGLVLAEQGRLVEAATWYRRALALKPSFPAASNNLGNVFSAQRKLGEAVASYRRALEDAPDLPQVHNNLGAALAEMGRPDEAITCYRRAIAIAPDDPQPHNSLGVALAGQGAREEAAACYRRALVLDPDFVEACNNLGATLKEQGALNDAVACHRRALALNPQLPEGYNNLGAALAEQERLDDAVDCYRRAIALDPLFAEPHNNLGTALRRQGRLDAAILSYREAIRLRPEFAGAHSNLAMALLAQGAFTEGWAEYEWRWKSPQMLRTRRRFARDQWHGEAGHGRTLLIHAEQGCGDTLQFCRYAPLAAARGWRIILQVQTPLVRLLRSLPGVEQVLRPGDALPPFDLQCPMLSLPLALGTTVATIPGGIPYLQADTTQVATWRGRLARGGPRVGLAWAGNPQRHSPALAAVDRRRSLDPARLAPLFEVPGLRFVSLQRGGPTAPAEFPLTDPMGDITDFADTAALVAGLDLVVSVDTAVAHLAGALGKPVWVLDRFDPCWRWLAGRRDSPWYPTLRLYRQPRPGVWGPVLDEVVRDLRRLVTPARVR